MHQYNKINVTTIGNAIDNGNVIKNENIYTEKYKTQKQKKYPLHVIDHILLEKYLHAEKKNQIQTFPNYFNNQIFMKNLNYGLIYDDFDRYKHYYKSSAHIKFQQHCNIQDDMDSDDIDNDLTKNNTIECFVYGITDLNNFPKHLFTKEIYQLGKYLSKIKREIM
ncbi:hypothetical protein ACO0QE_001200 [Hanseniaspora vineae]